MTDLTTPTDGAGDDTYQPSPEDMLLDEQSTDAPGTGYEPPLADTSRRWGATPWEESHDEPLDRRLRAEVPEGSRDGARDEDLAGRLVATDAGTPGRENDVYAEQEPLEGGAPAEEELAMHVVTQERLEADDARAAGEPVTDADDDDSLDERDEGA